MMKKKTKKKTTTKKTTATTRTKKPKSRDITKLSVVDKLVDLMDIYTAPLETLLKDKTILRAYALTRKAIKRKDIDHAKIKYHDESERVRRRVWRLGGNYNGHYSPETEAKRAAVRNASEPSQQRTYGNRPNPIQSTQPGSSQGPQSNGTNKRVKPSEREDQIIALLEEHGKMPGSQIRDTLGMSGIASIMKRLMDAGRVEFESGPAGSRIWNLIGQEPQPTKKRIKKKVKKRNEPERRRISKKKKRKVKK